MTDAFILLMASPGRVRVKKRVRSHHREITNSAERRNVLNMLFKEPGSLRAYEKRQRGLAKAKASGEVYPGWRPGPMTPRIHGSPHETIILDPEVSGEIIQELECDSDDEEEIVLRRPRFWRQ